MDGIELETALKTDSTALPILFGLVCSMWYIYHGIDDTDTPTEKKYKLDESVSN